MPKNTKHLPKKSDTVVKVAFCASRKNFEEEYIFNQEIRFSILFLSFRAKNFRNLVENFWKDSQNCIPRVPTIILIKNVLLQKMFHFLGFWPKYWRHLIHKNPALFRKLLSKRPKLFLGRKWNNNEEFVLFNFVSGLWAKDVQIFGNKFQQGCQIYILSVQKVILRKKNLIWRIIYLYIIRDFVWNIFVENWQKVFGSVVVTGIYACRKLFWGKIFLQRRIHSLLFTFHTLSKSLSNFLSEFSHRFFLWINPG